MKSNQKYLSISFLIAYIFANSNQLSLSLPDIEEYQLKNGMRILFSPNYEAPVVYFSMQINVGTLDSPENMPELAQKVFYELNNKTKKFSKKNQLKEKFYSLGNDYGNFNKFYMNLTTSRLDHICLKEDVKDCIEIFSEVLINPLLSFKNNPIEKLTMKYAPSSLFASKRLATKLHAEYMFNGLISYFRPSTRMSYSKKDAMDWYSKYIKPENITLMISGDINVLYLKKILKEYFEQWEQSTSIIKSKEHSININHNSGIKVQLTNMENVSKPIVRITKKTTDLNNFWDPAIQMALYIFYKDRLERIQLKMNNAVNIGWGWEQSNRMPFTYITFESNYNLINDFYLELLSEFNDVSNNTITENDLNKAVKTRTNNYQQKIYDPKTLNTMVLYYYNENGYSLEKVAQLVDDIQAVTLEDVNLAAKKVFDPNNFIMTVAGNKDSLTTFLNQFKNIEYYKQAEEIRHK